MEQAKKVYATLRTVLEQRDFPAQYDDEELVAYFKGTGEDMPMEFFFRVNAKSGIVTVFSKLPFSFPEERRTEGALGTLMLNDTFPFGCFDYNVFDGGVRFRGALCFRDSVLSESALDWLVGCAIAVVEEFNDKLLALSTGILDLDAFAKHINPKTPF